MIWQQDWSEKWALYSPDKIAVEEYESGRTLSYGELFAQSNRLAAQIQHQFQIKKGSRIAVLAEFCLEYILLFSAAQKAGWTLVPMNYRLSKTEIAYLLHNAAAELLVLEDKYASLTPDTPNSPPLLSIQMLGQLAQTPGSVEFHCVPVEEDHPIFILYTSGTTGFPKGALYTHKMLFWNSINTAISLIVNTESRTLNVMPPFHTGGWNVLLTPFLHHGAYTCLLKKFDAKSVVSLLQSKECTLFMGVPTMLQMMANEPEFEQADLSKLYYLIVGGEPMPIPLIERWHSKKVPVRQGYGLTEVGPNLTSLHQHDAIRKKGSIGRPNFYVNIRIVDQEGQDIPAGGEAGELWLQGPMVTPGYWQNPEASKGAFSADGTWFRTGDRVFQDTDHYLYVVDRIKNMFISGGENVYPAEIERVLLQHADVAEAVVVGIPDEKWGESGKAYIVLHPNTSTDAETLSAHCKTQLAKFKIPKQFAFVTQLPKTDSGKINRNALKHGDQ